MVLSAQCCAASDESVSVWSVIDGDRVDVGDGN